MAMMLEEVKGAGETPALRTAVLRRYDSIGRFCYRP